jgi:hypothetical protein
MKDNNKSQFYFEATPPALFVWTTQMNVNKML